MEATQVTGKPHVEETATGWAAAVLLVAVRVEEATALAAVLVVVRVRVRQWTGRLRRG